MPPTMPEKRPHPDSAAALQNGANKRDPAEFARKIAEAKARAEAIAKQRIGIPPAAASPSPSPAPPTQMSAAQRKIEEMKARVAAAAARTTAAPQLTPSQLAIQPPRRSSPALATPIANPDENQGRAGLHVGLHPLLLGDSVGDDKKKGKGAPAPKFATTMANRREADKRQELDLSGPSIEELKKNPYFDPKLGGARTRMSRDFIFNPQGKYIAQAAAMRKQEKLEAMKRRIAEQTRKAGIDEDNEKGFLIPEPPNIEWWDMGLFVEGATYDDVHDSSKILIHNEESLVKNLIQHPVQIEPPQDRNMPAPKPMFLTSKEQAKLRRQRRMVEHKEQQAKIRLGLVDPPAPKVKRSNLMRVLGDQAVKDPTAVEMMVNRQIAERAASHEAANEARKKTKEQAHEKIARNQQEDAARGILCSVYKIDNLSNAQHRYKIDINAKQNNLTGTALLAPSFCLVIVEGGAHSIAAYRKLMLKRIKWTENVMPASVREENKQIEQAWLSATDENGELKNLAGNKCQLVFEGEERARAFRKWSVRTFETDADAKEALVRVKMEGMWVKAKSMQ